MTHVQQLLPLRAEPRVITNVNFGKKKEPVEQPIYTSGDLPCLFVLGAIVKVGVEVVTIVGWAEIDDERHAIVHFAMSRSAAAELYRQLSELEGRAA